MSELLKQKTTKQDEPNLNIAFVKMDQTVNKFIKQYLNESLLSKKQKRKKTEI